MKRSTFSIKPMELNYAVTTFEVTTRCSPVGACRKNLQRGSIAIDRNDYANGYDLTADLGDEENFNQMRQGSMRLVLKFGQALATTVTLWSM